MRATEGRPVEANTHLEEARAILEPLNARPTLARAKALAQRLNAATAVPITHPGQPFSARSRGAGALGTGRSNHDIAQALFLSPRTVQRHVANAYLKIGAHNRAEATAYALRYNLA
ncbi:MAG: LuxR C-terminal-related transcriptional regulator [Thermomicrobiales bacterium]